MEVNVDKLSATRARISFSVPEGEFEDEVRRILAQLGKQTRMKGFRPGHVPAAVLEKAHGKEVRREARQRFVQKAYERALKEHELKPLAHPRVELGDTEPLAGVEFEHAFEVDLKPQFELEEYKGLEIESELTPVMDEEVEAAIEQARKNQAHPEPAGEEGLPEDGMALAKVELVYEGESVFQRDGLRLSPQVPLPGLEAEAFKAALVGARDGADIELPVVFPSDFEREEARGQTGTCRIHVAQAFRIVVPTREDLLKLLDLPDDASLVARARERLEEANREQEDRRIESALLERLIEQHEIELPEQLVEEQTKARLAEMRAEIAARPTEGAAVAAPAQVEAELAAAEEGARVAATKGAKAYFLIEALAEKEGLLVTQAELSAELATIAQRNRASVEEVRQYYQEQKLMPQLALEIVERKVRRFLRESARIAAPSTAGA